LAVGGNQAVVIPADTAAMPGLPER